MLRALLTAATLTALTLLSASSAQAAPRYCGDLGTKAQPTAVQLERGTASCKTALRIMRRYERLQRSGRCDSKACLKVIEGWKCSSATAAAYPRLASCTKRRALIGLYARGD